MKHRMPCSQHPSMEYYHWLRRYWVEDDLVLSHVVMFLALSSSSGRHSDRSPRSQLHSMRRVHHVEIPQPFASLIIDVQYCQSRT